MPQQFTQDQIEKLKSLGIKIDSNSPAPETQPEPIKLKIENCKLKINKPSPIFPLLSISGLTLLSFGGLVLLKGNNQKSINSSQITPSPVRSPQDVGEPTQVPKSIQHYLLTSQQYFSRALQQQSSQNPATAGSDQSPTIELLNNSILAATQAIKEFPNDYRGYQQRAIIYQALISSNPKLIDQSISDFATAFKLNSNSAEIARSLATLYAQKGDAQKTITYLSQTVSLEPTKAQNFYDLAKIQQQAGFLGDALDTYNKLIPLISDPTQKASVETEKEAIENIIAKNPAVGARRDSPSLEEDIPQKNNSDAPTIQASAGSNLIIAAPEEDSSISVTSQTETNSLSGNSTLSSGQKDITIQNNNISSTSQVYVTVTKGGKNQNLHVISKTDKSFVVGLDTPISEDIEFKWWIIN